MDDGPLPPIVENEARCPACGAQYVDSYRQGLIRVSSGRGCPRCEAAAGERRQARRPPKKPIKAINRRTRPLGAA
jgi:hypothetical protein